MYKIENPIGRAIDGMNNAGNAYGKMSQDIPANRKPGPTVGGSLMSGMGGAATMSMIGGTEMGGATLTAMGMGGPLGLGLGAALGIGAYLFS